MSLKHIPQEPKGQIMGNFRNGTLDQTREFITNYFLSHDGT